MILNLNPYQAPQPYPALRNVKPDKGLANALSHGYCGERSELSTVMQYAYHSLQCKEKAAEYSQMLRGIFYVETLHMDFLGNCVRMLGEEPQYLLPLNEKKIEWQSGVIDYMDSPAHMLEADITGEQFAVKFYMEMAASTKQPEISELLSRLAEDEKLHVRILDKLHKRLF